MIDFTKKNKDANVGYVYVVECDGHYKIGKTLTYYDRFYEYTKFYAEPTVVFCELVEDYSKVEFELHSIFLDKNIRGEWFDLNDNDLKVIERYLTINKVLPLVEPQIEEEKNNEPTKIGDFRSEKKPMTRIKGRYIKTMPKEQQIIYMLQQYPATYVALGIIKSYLMPNFNILVKNNKKYKVQDLARDMGITRQGAGLHIKKLKELNVIAEVDLGRTGKYWAINPYCYLAGDYVPNEIVRLFERK